MQRKLRQYYVVQIVLFLVQQLSKLLPHLKQWEHSFRSVLSWDSHVVPVPYKPPSIVGLAYCNQDVFPVKVELLIYRLFHQTPARSVFPARRAPEGTARPIERRISNMLWQETRLPPTLLKRRSLCHTNWYISRILRCLSWEVEPQCLMKYCKQIMIHRWFVLVSCADREPKGESGIASNVPNFQAFACCRRTTAWY